MWSFKNPLAHVKQPGTGRRPARFAYPPASIQVAAGLTLGESQAATLAGFPPRARWANAVTVIG